MRQRLFVLVLTAIAAAGCAEHRANAAYERGNACFEKQDLRCAIREYGAAVRLAPDDHKYRFNLALSLAQARLYDQAALELQRILSATPGDVEASRLYTLVSTRMEVRAQP